jgi:hypothetical protein
MQQMPAAAPRNSEHYTRAIVHAARPGAARPPGAQDELWGADGWAR